MRARHPEAAGRHACPRCAALLQAGQPVCDLCGFDTDRQVARDEPVHSVRRRVAVEAADPDTPSGRTAVAVAEHAVLPLPVHPVAVVDLSPAHPPTSSAGVGTGPARTITALAVVFGCLAVTRTVVGGWLLPTVGSPSVAVASRAVLAVLLLATVTAMAVVFLRWVAQARSFVEVHSVVPQRWSHRVAVLGWLVPVAGVLIGWQVLQDLWTASDPTTRHDPDARRPEPIVLTCWFGGLAVSSVVWLAGAVVLGGAPFVDMVSAVALAASGVCLGLAVEQVSRWQQGDTA